MAHPHRFKGAAMNDFSPAWPAPGRTPPPGRMGQAMLRLVAQSAAVAAVHALSARVRLVSLRSGAFRDLVTVPGDKLQVAVGGLAFRTFTPVRPAGAGDALDVIAYLHGGATPGAKWLAAAHAGDACHVRGPRRSLDVGAIHRSTVFFGDETSIGLAAALCATPLGGLDTHFVLEVDDPADTRRALDALAQRGLGRLGTAQLVKRRGVDEHLAEVEDVLARHARADAYRQYVLSGHACSIRRLSRALRGLGVDRRQVTAKAHWSPGKVGLD
jgi:NADPH-dependent ferric siderophore reductase